MKGTCTSCDIHYTYDGFTVGGKSYRLTEERPYMMVTNRCVQRPFLRPFPRCVPTVHSICAIFRSVLLARCFLCFGSASPHDAFCPGCHHERTLLAGVLVSRVLVRVCCFVGHRVLRHLAIIVCCAVGCMTLGRRHLLWALLFGCMVGQCLLGSVHVHVVMCVLWCFAGFLGAQCDAYGGCLASGGSTKVCVFLPSMRTAPNSYATFP